MTGKEILDQFYTLIDDASMDSVLAYQLMNLAKDEIESSREWEFLKKLDATKTASTTSAITTSKALPTDFNRTIRLCIYDGTQEGEDFLLVPFETGQQFKDVSGRWFIDLANSTFYLTANEGSAYTIRLYYIYQTDDITATTSPVFPTRFHPLLSLKMAMMYYATDGGEKSLAWDDRWTVFYNELFNQMILWDTRIKAQTLSNVYKA